MAATPKVEIVKVADASPAAMVTVPGTDALVLLEPRVPVRPPEGAGPLRVSVPVLGSPAGTLDGFSVKLTNAAGLMVN